MSTQESIADNLQCVRSRIHEAAQACGRQDTAVSLLAVSKTHPAAAIEAAYRAGQRHFGESYAQEAVEKSTRCEAWTRSSGILLAPAVEQNSPGCGAF